MKKYEIKKKNNNEELLDNKEYELKVDAVKTLTEALKENKANEITEEEKKQGVDPYKVDKLSRVPSWLKIFFIKFWVAGAICYFFMWGLGLYITNNLDMLLFIGIATGIINDVLVNNAFLHFESDKKEYHRYMMIPISGKKIWTLFVNVLLGIIQIYLVYYLYILTNYFIVSLKGLPKEEIVVNVEPLLFGIFYLIIDIFFLSIKNGIVKIINDAKEKSRHH